MRHLRVIAILSVCAAWLGFIPVANAQSPFQAERRTSYINRAVDVMRGMEPIRLDRLAEDIYRAGREACRADFGNPTIGCLIEVARERCATKPEAEQAACRAIADIVITNQLSETEFLDQQTRISLMNDSQGFRAAVQRELRARYAALATELILAAGDLQNTAPGPAIDRFCVSYTRTHLLAWQRCVAAIVWYIGTTEPREESP